MSAFTNATLMITGGTGSFGNTVLKHFLTTDIGQIRIFSRDEKKQDDMRHELQAKYPDYANKVKFYIGDVRNPQSIRDAMPGVDYIFHAAALKQVPSCEFFPMEAVRTNVIGTDNMLHAAIEAGVKRVVCLSTDKAAYPINAMGISKAMMEHVIYANARVAAERGNTVICCTRYGNVMCSRGSVIPLFIDQIRAGNPITITDPNMTRFLMNLDEAVDLVQFAFEHANPGDLFIQKADASTIGDLAKAVQKVFGDTGTRIIGTRHGEKLYETLMTREERLRSEDMGHYFRVTADSRDLNYDKFVVDGQVHTMADEAYTSHMCGIVGFTGTHQAAPILLDGLSKLEYRGYDSAGLAVRDGDHETVLVKAKGRLHVLAEKTDNGRALTGTCGIGHTRWATHGEPSEANAHPHRSDDGNVIGVHNGIIENYQELKDKLTRKGYTFYSQTDTEVAIKLVDYYYKKYNIGPIDAIAKTMVRIRGSYALALMFKDYPNQIWVARQDSPMIIGVQDGETYMASDVPAILKYTRQVYYIGNREMGCLEKGKVTFYIWRRMIWKFDASGFDFQSVQLAGIQPELYSVYQAAKAISTGSRNITLADLASPELVTDEAFHLIVCALLLAKYGDAILNFERK